MPRLLEILQPNVIQEFSHPIIGKVIWKHIPIDGWGLYFMVGPEKDECLVVDDTVMFDEQWEKVQG